MLFWKTARPRLTGLVSIVTMLHLTVHADAQQVAPSPPQETWEVLRLGGRDMGYGHITQRTMHLNGQEMTEIDSMTHIQVKRFGQTVTQTLRLVSHETPAGRLVDFFSELGSAGSQLVTRGRVAGNRLHITVTSNGQSSTQALDWDVSYRSPFAIEQSLRAAPPQSGETREFQMFLPVYNQVAKVTLVGQGQERVKLLDREQALRKVVSRTQLRSGLTLVSHMWVDDEGVVWKSVVQGIGQETYRADRSRALRAGRGEFDLGEFSVVRLGKLPRGFAHATSVTYHARLKADDPSSLFLHDDWQRVTKLNDHEVLVMVGHAGKNGVAEEKRKPFSPEDLAANALVQTGNVRVQEMARAVAKQERDPGRVARQLSSYVHRHMKVRQVSRALASAADVAASMEGDCTEHAILLVALCRVREIPARVAIGLVYSPNLGGFAYHMWCEAWFDDRWVPLDATRPDGDIGTGHLKMAVSNLHGVSPYEAFWPVMQAMGRLELEVVTSVNTQVRKP